MEVDTVIEKSGWSRLADMKSPPNVDLGKMKRYCLEQVRTAMTTEGIELCLLSNPLSLRYIADIRQFSTFQARVPVMYLAVPIEGPIILYGGLAAVEGDPAKLVDETRDGWGLTVFDAGVDLSQSMHRFGRDMLELFSELGFRGRQIALENMSPLATASLLRNGFEIHEAQVVMERARRIKSHEEIQGMKWSIAVAEHGMQMMKTVLEPGVRENQLWALLNFVNVANDGEWHDS